MYDDDDTCMTNCDAIHMQAIHLRQNDMSYAQMSFKNPVALHYTSLITDINIIKSLRSSDGGPVAKKILEIKKTRRELMMTYEGTGWHLWLDWKLSIYVYSAIQTNGDVIPILDNKLWP